MPEYFEYGEKEIACLARADKRLGEVISKVGMVKRTVIPDLFAALMHSVVGQQISTKAHETIWRKMLDGIGVISPDAIADIPPDDLQAYGLSFRKAAYMQGIARKVVSGEFDIRALVKCS